MRGQLKPLLRLITRRLSGVRRHLVDGDGGYAARAGAIRAFIDGVRPVNLRVPLLGRRSDRGIAYATPVWPIRLLWDHGAAALLYPEDGAPSGSGAQAWRPSRTHRLNPAGRWMARVIADRSSTPTTLAYRAATLVGGCGNGGSPVGPAR